MNVTIPRSGTSGQRHRVAATARRIITLASSSPCSRRKHEQIHAPAHACLTYSANGQLVTHTAPGW